LYENLSADLEETSTNLNLDGSVRSQQSSDFERKVKNRFLLIATPPTRLAGVQSETENIVRARNADYVFEIRRTSANDPWYLTAVAKLSAENRGHQTRQMLDNHMEIAARFFPWQTPSHDGVLSRILDGGVEIQQIDVCPTDPSLFDVVCATNATATSAPGVQVPVQRTIRMTLDPSNSFLPTQIVDDFELYRSTTTYSDYRNILGIQVPFVATTRWNPSGSHSVRTIHSLSTDPISDDLFRLIAYGLDEPDFVRRRSQWILYAVATIAFVSLFLLYLRRRGTLKTTA
jgi:hypothetical protein